MAISCDRLSKSYPELKSLYSEFFDNMKILNSGSLSEKDGRDFFILLKRQYSGLFDIKDFLVKELTDYKYLVRRFLAKSLNLEFVGKFRDGLAIEKKNSAEKFRLISITGEPVIDREFDSISYGGPDWWIVKNGVFPDSRSNILRKDGKFVFQKDVYYISPLYNGVAYMKDWSKDYFFIDSSGNPISDYFCMIEYDGTSENVAIVYEKSNCGFYFDLTTMAPLFKDKPEMRFADLLPFRGGIGGVISTDNSSSPLFKKYYINSSGDKLFEDKNFTGYSEFRNGRAVVRDDKGYFCIDTTGRDVWEGKRFKSMYLLNNDTLAYVELDNPDPSGNKYMIIDFSEESIDGKRYVTVRHIRNDLFEVSYFNDKNSKDSPGRYVKAFLNQNGERFFSYYADATLFLTLSLEDDLYRVYDDRYSEALYIDTCGEKVFNRSSWNDSLID